MAGDPLSAWRRTANILRRCVLLLNVYPLPQLIRKLRLHSWGCRLARPYEMGSLH